MERVLLVVHEMNRGGIENLIMNIYRAIDRNKIQFDFVVHVDEKCDFDDEIKQLGGKIYHCFQYKFYNHFNYKKWWNNFFKEHSKYKVIHAHYFTLANIYLRIAKKFGLKTIAHSHTSRKKFGIRGLVDKLLRINYNFCCDYKFACSIEAAKYLYKSEFEKAIIMKNGIDIDKYCFDEKMKKQIQDSYDLDGLVIGNVGNLQKVKNQKFLIDILKELIDLNIEVTLLLIGQSYVGDEYEQYAKEIGVYDNVVFAGKQRNVHEWLSALDVFAMPSLYEGLPVSAVEAQASGLTCLLSDTIPNDIDISGRVEFMSLEKSAKEWAEKIISMFPYDRTDVRQRIVAAGYDINSTTQWLTDFYLKIASE